MEQHYSQKNLVYLDVYYSNDNYTGNQGRGMDVQDSIVNMMSLTSNSADRFGRGIGIYTSGMTTTGCLMLTENHADNEHGGMEVQESSIIGRVLITNKSAGGMVVESKHNMNCYIIETVSLSLTNNLTGRSSGGSWLIILRLFQDVYHSEITMVVIKVEE